MSSGTSVLCPTEGSGMSRDPVLGEPRTSAIRMSSLEALPPGRTLNGHGLAPAQQEKEDAAHTLWVVQPGGAGVAPQPRAPGSARRGGQDCGEGQGSRGHGGLSNRESEKNRCESEGLPTRRPMSFENFAAGQTPVLPCTQPGVTPEEQGGRWRPPRRSWERGDGCCQGKKAAQARHIGLGVQLRARAWAPHPTKKNIPNLRNYY